MTLTAVETAGPFVLSQNSNTTWIQGEEQTITWDVANTDSPSKLPEGSILFSAKGDFTDTLY
jgi:hypothetical protein